MSVTYMTPMAISGQVAGRLNPVILDPASGVRPTSPMILEVGISTICDEPKIAKVEAAPSGTASCGMV